MEERLLFIISPPRAGSTLLQRMLGSHAQIFTYPEPHLITPLAYLGFHDLVDKAPYDHIHAAEAMQLFVEGLPHGEEDYLDAVRAYANTLYGRMLAPSGKRYFLDKTPGSALVLPFLTRLYPRARYVVLTRHPLAVASSYANSFFDGDWRGANRFNPIVSRYVPAIARLLREPPEHLLHVKYEQLVSDPTRELSKLCEFLALDFLPQMLRYGEHYTPQRAGRGDPINVDQHTRAVNSFANTWRGELEADADKYAIAREIAEGLDPEDVRTWGFEPADLLPGEHSNRSAATKSARVRLNGHMLQRRVMLALKKNIRDRPHGKLVQRLRYYCNVLLRE
jgi:hypothetical protein